MSWNGCWRNNLIKGGDINNAIVVVDKEVSEDQVERISKVFHKKDVEISAEGILNNLELRFPNEPARHKLLMWLVILHWSAFLLKRTLLPTGRDMQAM